MWLRQSTASQEIALGRFVDATDGNTEETALSIANTDIKLWVEGATTLASKNSGGATHIANGMYYAVLDATDTATLGKLEVHVHVSGALSVKREFMVLPAMVYDSLVLGTDRFDTNVTHVADTAQTAKDIGAAVPAAAAGASGGLLISGSNSGTTTLGALTVTGAMAVGGGVAITQSTTDAAGLSVIGNGAGRGVYFKGGATGDGVGFFGGDTSGHGARIEGPTDGRGLVVTGNGASRDGALFTGGGSGAGIDLNGGATGHGLDISGGGTSGNGVHITTTSGHGVNVAATGTDKHGVFVTGGNGGTSDGVSLVAGTGGVGLRSGSVTVSGATTLSGAVSFGSTFGVTGTVTFNALTVTNAFTVSGATTLTGAVTASNASNNIVGIDVAKISGDSTAADNAESFFDGTGYAGTNNVIPTVTTVNGLAAGVITAAAVATGAIDADSLAADAVTKLRSYVSGTSDSGTTTTMVDAARTEADTDWWAGSYILFTSGTIAGQCRLITGFTPASDTITFTPATTAAVGTQTYEIIPAANVRLADSVTHGGSNANITLDTLLTADMSVTDTLTASGASNAVKLGATENNAAADALLVRSITNTQDTADAHSLTTIILATLESSISGTTWTIRKTGGTTFATKTITVDAAADPITGVT